jgi:hypothetical protein
MLENLLAPGTPTALWDSLLAAHALGQSWLCFFNMDQFFMFSAQTSLLIIVLDFYILQIPSWCSAPA